MKTTGTAYFTEDSDFRIREILGAGDQAFEELNYIPSSDKLTYSNGFYVYCTALFIDIRGSSRLPEIHNRPVLAKIYRAYLSECVAILNQDTNCREIFINGDCVSGIFETPLKTDIDSTFFRAVQLNTLIKLLNWRLEQKGYAQLKCGIGIDYGRALMLKAGFKGHSINEIIWMGDVVNQASNLCHQGNKGSRKVIQVSPAIRQNITRDDYLKLLDPVHGSGLHLPDPIAYEGDLVGVEMNAWIEEQQANQKPKGMDLATLLALGSPQQGGRGLINTYQAAHKSPKPWL
ncbi:MAG: adenylate/guanylate cyclase domain-containing protein [Betaproteobacteria bacterium]|nr:adenylate/guanylate cyclase domain-containing protein [Betaproteobacteria bacterium]